MESFITSDKTLPIDLDGSTNPDLLTEVTYGEHGFSPMMEKSGTGRMSPVRGRTMKEYDQQLGDLKKENFNLKLRIYFMEERMNSKFTEEDIIKTNIELKIGVESLKKELKEKQELLEKASETIDTLGSQYSQQLEKEIATIKKDCEDSVTRAKQSTAELENEVAELGEKLDHALEQGAAYRMKLEDQNKQIQDLTEDLAGRDREIGDLVDKVREVEQQIEAGEQREGELKDQLEQLSTNLGRKDRDVHRLSMVVTEKMKVEGLGVLERDHLKDTVDDTKREMEKLRGKCADQQRDLEERKIMLGKLEDLLRTKEKDKQSMKKLLAASDENLISSKKAVKKLVEDLTDKAQEVKDLEDAFNQVQGELTTAKREVQLNELARQRETEKVGELEKNLENLARSLGKKEGELESVGGLLERTRRSLAAAETTLEHLNEEIQSLNKQKEQLEKERCRCDKTHPKDATDDQKEEIIELRRELDKLHGEIADRDEANHSKNCKIADLMTQLNEQNAEVQARSREVKQLRQQLGDAERGYKDKCEEVDALQEEWKTREKGYRKKSEELESVAQRINLTVASQMNGVDSSDQLQQILDELKVLNKAVQMDKHVHIDINSVLSAQDGGAARSSSSSSSSSCHSHTPQHGSKLSSRIPVLQGLSHTSLSPSSSDLRTLRQQVADLTQQKKDLENTLKATEETVRRQTQKMKHYKHMLLDEGLLLSAMSRSSSETNIDKSSQTSSSNDSHGRSRSRSTENLQSCVRSVSPTTVAMQAYKGDLGEDLNKLLKDNVRLKQQVDGYRRVLRVFQDRNTSPDSDDPDLQEDGGPEPISAESASCLLGSWLDMVDDFLTDLSQQDQNGHGGQSSTTRVSRLRRGMVQAKGALRTLSGTSIGQQSSEGEGRESPDSGCSDNLASIPNNSLRSPLGSPGHHGHSPASSPRNRARLSTSPRQMGGLITSPENNARLTTSPQQTRLITSPRRQTGYNNNSGDDKHFKDLSQSKVDQDLINISVNQCDKGSSRTVTLSDYSGTFGAQSDRFNSETNDNQSMERLRHRSAATDQGTIIDADYTDGSLCSTDTGLAPNKANLDDTPFFSHVPNHIGGKLLEPKHHHRLSDRFYNQTFSSSFVNNVTLNGPTDISRLGDLEAFSRIEFDQTLDDGTMDQNVSDNASTMEMKQRIISLEEMIQTYEEQIRSQCGPNMDSLKHHLMELRHLRIQLEKTMKTNENLEKQLSELYKISECTIHEQKCQIDKLQNELTRSNDQIREKAKIIIEKEQTINETKISLMRFRDKSEKDSADAALFRGRVEAMTQDMNNSKSRSEQLTSACMQLRSAVEQYKHRCEQLEDDNKKHVSAIERYQERMKDIKNMDNEVEVLKSRITELESDLQQFRENEEKYKHLLSQLRSQVCQLNGEIDSLKEKVKEQSDELGNANLEIELKANTISKQSDELNDMQKEVEFCRDDLLKMKGELSIRDGFIEKLKFALQQKNHALDELEKTCEKMNMANEKLTLHIQQEKQSCQASRMETEKQREQLDSVRDQLRQSTQDRERLDQVLGETRQQLQDISRQKDKYLFNLKVTCKEISKFKHELREAEKKLNDTSALNSTLQVELNVREKLMEERGDRLTDDDKENIIAELLNELKSARVQMTKILEQNDSINRKMIELIHQKGKEAQQKGKPDSCGSVSQTTHEETRTSFSHEHTDYTASLRVNHSMPPLRDLASGMARTDNLSCSLPLREGTPGGPATAYSSFPSKPSMTTGEMGSSKYHIDAGRKDNHFDSFDGSFKSCKSDAGSHFSVPGPIYKQGITDQCLLYNVNDSPKYLASLTQMRIDSDMRSLFAVGMIDHFEKLRKETNECNVLLKGLAIRISERLKVFNQMPASESMEYSTLKELSFSTENLQVCVNSQMSMIDGFWTSELPAPNEKGEFVNQKMIDEISMLHDRLREYEEKLSRMASQSLKEEQMCRSLESTLDVVTRAKHNLQQQQKLGSPRSPPRY